MALSHLEPPPTEHATEGIEETVPDIGGRGGREIGSATMTGVAVQGELGDHQDRAAHVAERALHPTILFKDTQASDLRREALAVLGSILDADAEQDDHAPGDLGSPLVIDVHGSRAHPSNDRAQLVAHSNIQGLSPRTTASTSLAERCPGVKTVMLLPSGRREPDVASPKPQPGLQKQRLA